MTESKSTRKPNADGVRTLPASVSLPESLIRIAERISARGCRLLPSAGLCAIRFSGCPSAILTYVPPSLRTKQLSLRMKWDSKLFRRELLSAWSKFTPTGKSLNTQPSVPTNTPPARAPPDEHTVFKNTRGGFASARLFGKRALLRYSDAGNT